MKIVCISDLPPYVTGGAESQAARLVEAWIRDGHEVVCLGRSLPDARLTLADGIEVATRAIATAKGPGRAMRAGSYFLSLAALLVREAKDADVVYCRFLGDAAVTASLLKRLGLLAAPLVATPASAGAGGDMAYLGSVPGRALLVRLLERGCDRINIISPALADELRGAGFSGCSFTAIPNGVPLRPLQRPARRGGSTRLVCVSRLVEQKGVDLLLEALAGNLHAAWTLHLVGDGPDEARLRERAVALRIDGRIHWHGRLPAAAVRDQLMAADLFVLPSRYEGMSNAALEAMEAGLALLITRCGGIDLHVDPSMGWVVPSGDASALANGLRAALGTDSETLADMGRNARLMAEETFSIESMARRHLELFRSLATPVDTR